MDELRRLSEPTILRRTLKPTIEIACLGEGLRVIDKPTKDRKGNGVWWNSKTYPRVLNVLSFLVNRELCELKKSKLETNKALAGTCSGLKFLVKRRRK